MIKLENLTVMRVSDANYQNCQLIVKTLHQIIIVMIHHKLY